MGDCCSLWLDIACDVPQGSVLGPKLLILCISDICSVSKVLKLDGSLQIYKYINIQISKFLGVTTDEKPGNCKSDYESLHILYCSVVSPHLTYCAEVWDNNQKSTLHSLFILQKQSDANYPHNWASAHTNSLFLQLENNKICNSGDISKSTNNV